MARLVPAPSASLHLFAQNLHQVDPASLPIFPVCPSQVLIGPCSIKWLILIKSLLKLKN